MTDPMLGGMVGPYEIQSVVGRGGMGVVYRAVDARLGRTVALKLVAEHLAADATFVRRFLDEGRAAAALEHPNVVPVYDVGEHQGRPWLAMRLVEGENLAELLVPGPLRPRRALHLVGQIASALDALHARGHVHRDVKPENVLVGPGDHAMLSDFGLARAVQGTRITQPGGFAASPAYASPEQLRGDEVGPAGDQYALTGVLFTCLTGRRPFPGDDVLAVLMAHATAPPPRVTDHLPRLPPAIDDVIARGMAKDPAERFPTCQTMVEVAGSTLLPTDGGVTAPASPPPPAYAPPLPRPVAAAPAGPAAATGSRWQPWHTALVVVAVLALIGALTAVMLSTGDGGERVAAPTTTRASSTTSPSTTLATTTTARPTTTTPSTTTPPTTSPPTTLDPWAPAPGFARSAEPPLTGQIRAFSDQPNYIPDYPIAMSGCARFASRTRWRSLGPPVLAGTVMYSDRPGAATPGDAEGIVTATSGTLELEGCQQPIFFIPPGTAETLADIAYEVRTYDPIP